MKRGLYIVKNVFAVFFLLLMGCSDGEMDHPGHDHSKHGAHEGHAHEEGETEADHADHGEGEDEHGAEEHLELTDKAIQMAGIKFDRVKMRKIKNLIELAGEVGLNEDRVVHVVPRFPGIVRSVNKRLGDRVKAGEVLAVIESNESMSRYKITSASKGTVIEKHITPGEHVPDDASVYVVADLSNVWVNLSIYAKDIQNVRKGSEVEITTVGNNLSAKGKISYISPVFNQTSRVAQARVVLSNPRLQWRPGMFVRGVIRFESSQEVPAVQNVAVQTLHETTVVFVRKEENEFNPVLVVPGDSDSQWTQIVKGLHVNDEYVSKGAFELKAQIVTGSLGGHAGHGH